MAKTITRQYPAICSNCNGTGTILNPYTTIMYKTCSVCNGTGVIIITETIYEGDENDPKLITT